MVFSSPYSTFLSSNLLGSKRAVPSMKWVETPLKVIEVSMHVPTGMHIYLEVDSVLFNSAYSQVIWVYNVQSSVEYTCTIANMWSAIHSFEIYTVYWWRSKEWKHQHRRELHTYNWRFIPIFLCSHSSHCQTDKLGGGGGEKQAVFLVGSGSFCKAPVAYVDLFWTTHGSCL